MMIVEKTQIRMINNNDEDDLTVENSKDNDEDDDDNTKSNKDGDDEDCDDSRG